MSANYRDARSLGELFSELADETRTLLRQEIELARTELTQKAKVVGRNAMLIAIGGVLLLAGLLTSIAWLVIAIGSAIGYGWSSFLVAAAVIGGGAALVMKGKKTLARASLSPDQTKAELREVKTWAKQQVR